MWIAGFVAGALCASVGWMVVTQGLLTTRAQRRDRRADEQALVTDCLANVDRVIEQLPTFEPAGSAEIIALRTFERDVDQAIALSNVQLRHAPTTPPPTPASDAVILEPSMWPDPRTHAPRSVAATA